MTTHGIVVPEEIDEVVVADLTTKAMNGTGVFDVLMSAIQTRLDEQYSLERIKGTEYSKVYLGSMEAAISQGIQFLLGSELLAVQKLKIEADIDLTRSQILESIAKIALTEAQIRKIDAEIVYIGLQGDKLAVDTLLVEAQIRKIDADIILTGAQTDKVVQDIATSQAQEDKLRSDIELDKLKGLKLTADTALTVAQRDKTISDKALIDQNLVNAITQNELLTLQKAKIVAETVLLGQKKDTEEAQTSDIVAGGAVRGMVGKQKTLLDRQADGFLRKAEQDLAKILTDTWNVRRTTDPTTTVEGQGLTDNDIAVVMTKAQEGIDVVPPPYIPPPSVP